MQKFRMYVYMCVCMYVCIHAFVHAFIQQSSLQCPLSEKAYSREVKGLGYRVGLPEFKSQQGHYQLRILIYSIVIYYN